MRVAIMQPYIFPYIGYFQLIQQVDNFIFLDDVNFIKKGWINRNRLLISGEIKYFSIPIKSISQNTLISQTIIHDDDLWRKKLSKSIEQSYKNAPQFSKVFEIFEAVIFSNLENISDLAKKSIGLISDYMNLKPNFSSSSNYSNDQFLRGQDRIIDLCEQNNATQYWNLPGGRSLYSNDKFLSKKIDLQFIDPYLGEYKQFSSKFQPGLSVIDLLMHVDKEKLAMYLKPKQSSI